MFIKGFEKDLKCRSLQFEIGKVYDTGAKDNEIKLCTNTVFHFCRSLQQVHTYYSCNDEDNRYCEIEVLGALVEDNNKCGSNKIKIVREIIGDELKHLKGLERGNTGLFNTGNWNIGDYNVGNSNIGEFNTGSCNTGSCNTGNYNTGVYNTGDYNTNYYNTGNGNAGDCNTGNCNTGNCNTGNRNTGDCNTGDYNIGMFNSCNYSNGFFNTKEPTINIFNIDSGMTISEFLKSDYYYALTSSPFRLTKKIEYTDEEKKTDKEKALIGSYLKVYSFKEACQNWWNNMSDKNKEIIKSIPNFDAKIFKKITGIKI